MKELQIYFEKGLIKRQRPNFKQIQLQLEGAEKDFQAFKAMAEKDLG